MTPPYTVVRRPQLAATPYWQVVGPGLGEMDGQYGDRELAERECERRNAEAKKEASK